MCAQETKSRPQIARQPLAFCTRTLAPNPGIHEAVAQAQDPASGTFAVSEHLTHELNKGFSIKEQGTRNEVYENGNRIMDSGLVRNNGIKLALTQNLNSTSEVAPFGGISIYISTYSVQRSGALTSRGTEKRGEHGMAVSRTKPGQHPVQCGRKNYLPR